MNWWSDWGWHIHNQGLINRINKLKKSMFWPPSLRILFQLWGHFRYNGSVTLYPSPCSAFDWTGWWWEWEPKPSFFNLTNKKRELSTSNFPTMPISKKQCPIIRGFTQVHLLQKSFMSLFYLLQEWGTKRPNNHRLS